MGEVDISCFAVGLLRCVDFKYIYCVCFVLRIIICPNFVVSVLMCRLISTRGQLSRLEAQPSLFGLYAVCFRCLR